MGYQQDYNEYHGKGKDRSDMFERYAASLPCPNPVCQHDLNRYQATGDQLCVGGSYSERMSVLEKALCPYCHIPLIHREREGSFGVWEVEHSRAAIMVVVAPHHTDLSFPMPPLLIKALQQVAEGGAAARSRVVNDRVMLIRGLASVIHQWSDHNVDEMCELAALHCQDVNQHTLAALIRGEAPQPQNTKYAWVQDGTTGALIRLVFKLPMHAMLYAAMISACGDPARSGDYLRFACSEGAGKEIIKTILDPAGAVLVDRVGEL